MLSIAAPFNKDAAIPAGEVTVRDVAGLYIFDNTLLGITVHRRAGQGLPRDLRGLLQAGERHRPVPGLRRHQRRRRPPRPTARPTTTTTSWAGSTPGLTYDIDISKAPGSRISEPAVRRGRRRRRRPVRHRHQQLPAVRWRQLPARQDRAGALQPHGRDPPADDRLGHGQQGHRPAGVLHRRLAADQRRRRRSPSPADPPRRERVESREHAVPASSRDGVFLLSPSCVVG